MTIPEIREKYEEAFKLIYGVPLSQYWDDARGGFQAAPFITQVLEYEGEDVVPRAQRMYGKPATGLLGAIYGDLMDYWFQNEINADR